MWGDNCSFVTISVPFHIQSPYHNSKNQIKESAGTPGTFFTFHPLFLIHIFCHPQSSHRNITWWVCLLRSSMQGVTEQSANSFTQEDLNQGKIIYHQQAAGSTNDSVLLEATNGVTKVGPVRLEIDIVPMLIPLQVQDVSRGYRKETDQLASFWPNQSISNFDLLVWLCRCLTWPSMRGRPCRWPLTSLRSPIITSQGWTSCTRSSFHRDTGTWSTAGSRGCPSLLSLTLRFAWAHIQGGRKTPCFVVVFHHFQHQTY